MSGRLPGRAYKSYEEAPSSKPRTVFTQSSDGYRFGIEIELTLSPKVQNIHQFNSSLLPGPMEDDGTYPWEQIAAALTMLLDRILWNRGMGRASQLQSYDNWCVTFDSTIKPPKDFSGFEIISPILTTEMDWRVVIETIYAVVDAYFVIQASPSCGTHIHITPGRRAWNVADLRALSKAIVLWDPVIEGLLPEERRIDALDSWYRSNIHGQLALHLEQFHLHGFDPLFQVIDDIEDRDEMVDFVSPNRAWAWNFCHVKGESGTVEFRKPPMALTSSAAVAWIEFTLMFVRVATGMETGYWKDMGSLNARPGIRALERFVRLGIMPGTIDGKFGLALFQDLTAARSGDSAGPRSVAQL